jgi:AbrB family looped-hinge helix DNA binding protein
MVEDDAVKETLTRMTRKGQITVPAEIRRALNLQVGDKVAISLEEGGAPHARLRPVRSVADMTFGVIPARKQPEDFEELRQMFMESATERDSHVRAEHQP